MRDRKKDRVDEARRLLGLPEQATLKEVKKAYRRLSKKNHPDTASGGEGEIAMTRITEAYRLLRDYCENYPVVFSAADGARELDGEEWWMERFGQDPLWGPGRE